MIAARKRKIKNDLSCWLMGGLPILGFFMFTVAPMLISFYLSFTKLSTYNFLQAKWIGLRNYIELFKDPMFYRAIVNTLYSLLMIPMNLMAGLLIAMALHSKRVAAKKFLRIVFFIPYLCSGVVLATTFTWIFDAEFGVINGILKSLGRPKLGFFRDSKMFMPTMFVLSVWSSMGYYALLFYAALAGIPQTLLEAAEIDGAGATKRFTKIIFPMITPTTFYLFTTGLIAGLQTFSLFQMVGSNLGSIFGGPWGPNNAAIVVVYYLYVCSFTWLFTFGIGYGSAMAWVLAAVVVILTVINFRVSNRWVHYD